MREQRVAIVDQMAAVREEAFFAVDQIAGDLKRLAYESGRPFKEVVNETLRAGLQARTQPTAERYELRPAHLGGVRAGFDLDHALQLADTLEDEEIARKLWQRK